MDFVSCSNCKKCFVCEWAKTFMWCRKFNCSEYEPKEKEQS